MPRRTARLTSHATKRYLQMVERLDFEGDLMRAIEEETSADLRELVVAMGIKRGAERRVGTTAAAKPLGAGRSHRPAKSRERW